MWRINLCPGEDAGSQAHVIFVQSMSAVTHTHPPHTLIICIRNTTLGAELEGASTASLRSGEDERAARGEPQVVRGPRRTRSKLELKWLKALLTTLSSVSEYTYNVALVLLFLCILQEVRLLALCARFCAPECCFLLSMFI